MQKEIAKTFLPSGANSPLADTAAEVATQYNNSTKRDKREQLTASFQNSDCPTSASQRGRWSEAQIHDQPRSWSKARSSLQQKVWNQQQRLRYPR